jgi:hypothetical protein
LIKLRINSVYIKTESNFLKVDTLKPEIKKYKISLAAPGPEPFCGSYWCGRYGKLVVGVLWVSCSDPDLQFTVPGVAVLYRSVLVCSHEYWLYIGFTAFGIKVLT